MTDFPGTIRGVSCVSRTFSGSGAEEVWLITADFGAYTASGNSASIANVAATISARARDKWTRTLKAGMPAFAGIDASGAASYMIGATNTTALDVSSDSLVGDLGSLAAAADSPSPVGVGVLALVSLS